MNPVIISKALGDETRFRLLMALRDGELCVCQLVALVDLSSATVSKHLLVLRNADMVESRKEGRWMYYQIAAQPHPTVARALEWATIAWNEMPEARADKRKLERVCRQSPETLCLLLRKERP